MGSKPRPPAQSARSGEIDDELGNSTELYSSGNLVRFHQKRMMLWSTATLHEELRVLDAVDAMSAFDDWEYPPDVVRRSQAEIAAQRQAIRNILQYRDRRGIEIPEPSYGIPREIIDELKARRPIAAEAETLTDLRRCGNTLRGCCPICPGTSNPSTLAIWPDVDRWRCFRCNVGGDVIAWVMAWQRWGFPEAIQYLSGVAGVELPTASKPSGLRSRRVS